MISKKLTEYEKNIFSQFGEDGIIDEIIKRIGLTPGTCVEFGAWDGVLFSNTAALWTKNWKGVLIEGNEKRFKTLLNVCKPYHCICINKYVTSSGENSLEQILEDKHINLNDVRILSIDIDGGEYHIFKTLTKLHPDIILLEYNPTIPANMLIISDENSFFGSSAKALNDLAQKKGYHIVAITKTNCIFVDQKHMSHFSDLNSVFEDLFDSSNLTYLITGYNGNYAFSRYPSFGITLPFNKKNLEHGTLTFINHSPLKTRINYIKDFIKKVSKTILSPKVIELFKYYRSYIFWLLKGKPVPAHMHYKRYVLIKYAKKYHLDTFIETGTAGGGSIVTMAKHFKKLFTIELDPTLYHQGRALGVDYPNIEFLQGDSGIVITDVLKKIDHPALFWLDAHYSGGNTAKGTLETPIVQELKSIMEHKIKSHVIAIDDIREFNGSHDYPDIKEFEKFINNYRNNYTFTYENDIMIIEPVTK